MYLHDKRFVHRDIKPCNILIKSNGVVKISDFGVSAVINDSIEGRNTLVGTYLYMSVSFTFDFDFKLINVA